MRPCWSARGTALLWLIRIGVAATIAMLLAVAAKLVLVVETCESQLCLAR